MYAYGESYKFYLFLFFQEQDGITPHMFKTVIGRGHPEFSTNRQQDAQEFFMHLLSTVDRAEVYFYGVCFSTDHINRAFLSNVFRRASCSKMDLVIPI